MAFNVTGYNARKATESIFYSNPFYSSPGGYNMSIKTDTNGTVSGKGTHVTVSAKLLEGSYDASLSWPFIGTVTITLLNQLADYNHQSKTLKIETAHNVDVGSNLGYPQFISHSALSHDPVNNTQYLKNDTLYFRVTVTVGSHKPWLVCTHHE